MHGLYTGMRKKYSKAISEASSILYEGTLSLPDDTKQSFAQLIISPVAGLTTSNIFVEFETIFPCI